MPRRKRIQEIKRKMRRAIAEVEAENMQAFTSALAESDPLGDHFWREYEQGVWCCPSCDYNHPLSIKWDARQEINAYLKRGST